MRDRLVVIEGLAGTLSEPEANAMEACLLIAGSGPTDRNGNSPLGLTTDSYRLLAQALASAGYASLRFDKRGIGGSAGIAIPEAQLTIQTFVDDAARLSRWLGEAGGFRRVHVIGHSEGSLIASLLPTGSFSGKLVSLTGPGLPLPQVLRRQLAGLPAELRAPADAAMAALDNGSTVPSVPDALAALFRPSIVPFLRSLWNLDPAALMAGVSAPRLVVGGGLDLQITRMDFDRLTGVAPGIASRWFPTMTHTLKDGAGLAPAETYRQPDLPLAEGLSAAIGEFLGT